MEVVPYGDLKKQIDVARKLQRYHLKQYQNWGKVARRLELRLMVGFDPQVAEEPQSDINNKSGGKRNMDIKTGIKTTEFWTTILTQILGLLMTVGVISPSENSEISQGLTQIIGGLGVAIPPIAYAISRGMAKKK